MVNAGLNKNTVANQISRFIDLIFGSNVISPTKMEYGLYIAKAASMRSLDLSRQVGAAIFSKQGEVLTLGSNEVPKAKGGTYWCDDAFDDRDYKRGFDSNLKRKVEFSTNYSTARIRITRLLKSTEKRNSSISLEYTR